MSMDPPRIARRNPFCFLVVDWLMSQTPGRAVGPRPFVLFHAFPRMVWRAPVRLTSREGLGCVDLMMCGCNKKPRRSFLAILNCDDVRHDATPFRGPPRVTATRFDGCNKTQSSLRRSASKIISHHERLWFHVPDRSQPPLVGQVSQNRIDACVRLYMGYT